MQISTRRITLGLRAILLAVMAITLATVISGQSRAVVSLPEGTSLFVRMTDSVDSSANQVGTRFAARLETNLAVDGRVIAPAGTIVYGQLVQSKQANRIAKSEPELELTNIAVGGAVYPIFSNDYQVSGNSGDGRSVKCILGGTAMGALGNAGIGAAIGAVVGTTAAVRQKGEKVSVPSETLLEFRLQQPASLPVL